MVKSCDDNGEATIHKEYFVFCIFVSLCVSEVDNKKYKYEFSVKLSALLQQQQKSNIQKEPEEI